jgi:hypothetical protein
LILIAVAIAGPKSPDEGGEALPGQPLSAEELIDILRQRWQATYDLQVVKRQGRFHVQVMWAYLEQQSFPLEPEAFRLKLDELVGLLNGLGVAAQVRQWLLTTADKPRLGRAMTLPLEIPPDRASEFLL